MLTNPVSIGFNVPFHEAIVQAVKRGVVLPDVYYGQLQGLARQQAFSIAGITSLDTLQAVKDSLDKVIKEGGTFGAWQKHMLESGTLNLPRHRLDNIYRTNLQGSYMAARWDRILLTQETRPYIMYDALNDSRVRPAHLALDGIIRRVDDPFWTTHSPPNGYRCRCSIRSLSEHQAKARSGQGKGLNQQPVLDDGTPALPDKGWDYNPSDRLAGIRQAITDRTSQCTGLFIALSGTGKKRHNSPIWCNTANYSGIMMQSLQGYTQAEGKMPEPRPIQGVERLSERLSEGQLFSRFMKEFGGKSELEFTDLIGNQLKIDRNIFLDISGKWKIMKGERAKWLLYTAINIKEPDEIWLESGRHGGVDKLYYLSRFDAGMRDYLQCITVFDRKQSDNGIWSGRTNYATTQTLYLERKRKEIIDSIIKYWRWE